MPATLSGIILAGGKSSRMGQDKATLAIGGIPMLDVVARRLAPAVSEIVVVGPPRTDISEEVVFVPDLWPGEGPLGGVISGLRRIQYHRAIIVGCDMPLISPRLIRDLNQLLREGDEAVIPRVKGVLQPLHAIYIRAAERSLSAASEDGLRSLKGAVQRLAVQFVEVSNAADVKSFTSVNTPTDLGSLSNSAQP